MTRRTYLQVLYTALQAIQGKKDCETAAKEIMKIVLEEEQRKK